MYVVKSSEITNDYYASILDRHGLVQVVIIPPESTHYTTINFAQ